MQIWRHAAPIILITATLSGCATTSTETKNLTAAQYYRAGIAELHDGNYTQAQKFFQTLRAHYPFGNYARQAQLESMYVYYKQNEPKSAVEEAQSFIKENPLSPEVAYAYYIQGLANFNVRKGLMSELMPINPIHLDVKPLKESFKAFKTLVEKYPDSAYAPDARNRMVFLRNELAQHQLYVAGYYMKRGAYVAVLNRCKVVLQEYPGSSPTLKALQLMVTAYTKLGMPDLAAQTEKVLKLNQSGNQNSH